MSHLVIIGFFFIVDVSLVIAGKAQVMPIILTMTVLFKCPSETVIH